MLLAVPKSFVVGNGGFESTPNTIISRIALIRMQIKYCKQNILKRDIPRSQFDL